MLPIFPLVYPGKPTSQNLAGTSREYACLVMCYLGCNVGADDSQPTGDYQTVEAIKKIAPQTKDSGIAIFLQGYEKTAEGKWRTARYLICDGKIEDQTRLIRGHSYRETPLAFGAGHVLIKTETKGEEVSLFDPLSFGSFLFDAPKSKQDILLFSSHGHGVLGFSGEAVKFGQICPGARESLSVPGFKRSILARVEANGKKLALLYLKCCLGGHLELELTLKSVASLILASPEIKGLTPPGVTTEPLKKLLEYRDMEPLDLGKRFVVENDMMRCGVTDHAVPTLVITDTEKFQDLYHALDNLGTMLHSALNDKDLRRIILTSLLHSFAYGYEEHESRDPKSFFHNLLSEGIAERLPGSSALIDESLRLLDGTALYQFKNKGHDWYTGTGTKDYSETGPMAAYIPLPKVLKPKYLAEAKRDFDSLNPSSTQYDFKSLLGFLIHCLQSEEHSVYTRSFLNIFEHHTQGYPALFSPLPEDHKVRSTLRESLPLFEEVLEYKTQFFKNQPVDQRSTQKVVQALQRLQDAFAPIDFQAEYTNMEPSAKARLVTSRLQKKFKSDLMERLNYHQYVAMDGIPPGWKNFVLGLYRFFADEELMLELVSKELIQADKTIAG